MILFQWLILWLIFNFVSVGVCVLEEKRSELDIIKILNARATVTVHIYMVIVALVHLCTILHPLMWVFFLSNCVK